ncbi:MAG: right-handed parallel beta-helix repeat-containing protein [Bradyrhizobium sp.]
MAIVAPILFCAFTQPAWSQATRTWVSGVGDDVNPCSRTAPCKTFAGAISKTAAGGEISVLDPGGFGAVTVTKSITLNGDGTLAGILNAGTNGVIVNAAGVKVVLRNLSINGAGTGINGVHVLAAAEVTVDQCTFSGLTGNGVNVATAASANIFVTNSSFTRAARGVSLNTTAGFVAASVTDSRFYGLSTAGVSTTSNSTFIEVARSTFTGNGAAAATSGGNGIISVADSLASQNSTAFNAGAGSTIRITRNTIFDNPVGFAGTITTGGDNKTAGNGAGGTLVGGVATQ